MPKKYNSIANALELHLFCIKPSTWFDNNIDPCGHLTHWGSVTWYVMVLGVQWFRKIRHQARFRKIRHQAIIWKIITYWHCNFTGNGQDIYPWYSIKISHSRLQSHLPGVSRSISRSDGIQVDPWSGIILGMGSANERWHYIVTSSLIGWAHTQNDPFWPTTMVSNHHSWESYGSDQCSWLMDSGHPGRSHHQYWCCGCSQIMEEGDDTSFANTISSCYDNTDDIFRKYSQWGVNFPPMRAEIWGSTRRRVQHSTRPLFTKMWSYWYMDFHYKQLWSDHARFIMQILIL